MRGYHGSDAKFVEKEKRMRPIDADALKGKAIKVSTAKLPHTYFKAVGTREIDKAPTIEQPTWISVDERLPTAEDANEYNEVLAICQDGKKTACQLWEFKSSYRPLYWLPFSALPQPPKGVE